MKLIFIVFIRLNCVYKMARNEITYLTRSFSSLSLYKEKVILLQKNIRGYLFRLKRLPFVMYKIQKFLKEQNIIINNSCSDGRINSCFDEQHIINILRNNFKIRQPKHRAWFDVLIFDNLYGWLPINIKTTTMKSCDNIGNLALCVQSYTNEKLQIFVNHRYDNGNMSKLLINKLKNKEYNFHPKKDYYFLVINKKNPNDIIINSIKGLTKLTPNIHNLPFQVCWNDNREFVYEHITVKIKMFLDCLKKPKPSWQETFMEKIRNVDI